jgi:hypothetical protein
MYRLKEGKSVKHIKSHTNTIKSIKHIELSKWNDITDVNDRIQNTTREINKLLQIKGNNISKLPQTKDTI